MSSAGSWKHLVANAWTANGYEVFPQNFKAINIIISSTYHLYCFDWLQMAWIKSETDQLSLPNIGFSFHAHASHEIKLLILLLTLSADVVEKNPESICLQLPGNKKIKNLTLACLPILMFWRKSKKTYRCSGENPRTILIFSQGGCVMRQLHTTGMEGYCQMWKTRMH